MSKAPHLGYREASDARGSKGCAYTFILQVWRSIPATLQSWFICNGTENQHLLCPAGSLCNHGCPWKKICTSSSPPHHPFGTVLRAACTPLSDSPAHPRHNNYLYHVFKKIHILFLAMKKCIRKCVKYNSLWDKQILPPSTASMTSSQVNAQLHMSAVNLHLLQHFCMICCL